MDRQGTTHLHFKNDISQVTPAGRLGVGGIDDEAYLLPFEKGRSDQSGPKRSAACPEYKGLHQARIFAAH